MDREFEATFCFLSTVAKTESFFLVYPGQDNLPGRKINNKFEVVPMLDVITRS